MSYPTMPNVRDTFTAFFEGWLARQQSFLEQLLVLSVPPPNGADRDGERRELVEQVLGHYQEYYEEKAKVANEDVFVLFSPPWLSSFERTLLWMSGFKPSLVFKLVNGAMGDLSAEQVQRIEMVKVQTRRAERNIAEAMAGIQESVAVPPLFVLMRLVGSVVDGEESALDTAMEELKSSMVVVIGNADALLRMTVCRVMEILSPVQKVKLLAGAAQFQLQIRRWGLQRDSRRAMNSSESFND